MEHIKTKYLVVGAGVGGLAAGARLKERGETDFLIVDKCESLPVNLQNGVHYLHSNDFGTPFEFELKEITATEEIWDPRKDEFKKAANIPEMMDYSMKVMGLRHPSSIMDPSNRNWKTYIPMSNNMNDLLQGYHDYIGKEHFKWNKYLERVATREKCAEFSDCIIDYEKMISTAPLNKFGTIVDINLGSDYGELEFNHQALNITNYRTKNIVPNWLVGIYISDNRFPVYRITILNNIISMESLTKLTASDEHITKYHLDRYFDYELDTKQEYTWETGRIWGLTKDDRNVVVKLFEERDIFLLGRYGEWDGKRTIDTTVIKANQIIDSIAIIESNIKRTGWHHSDEWIKENLKYRDKNGRFIKREINKNI